MPSGQADFVYGFLIYGDYLYASTQGPAPKIVKINKNNFSDYTVAALPGSDSYTQLVQAKAKLYALSPSGSAIVVAEINPTTLAATVVINDSSGSSFASGLDSMATDGTYLYILASVGGVSAIARYSLPAFTRTNLALTNYTASPALRYSGGNLYLNARHSSDAGTMRLVMVSALSFTVTGFGSIPTSVSGGNFMTAIFGNVYVAFEDNPGVIWRFDSNLNVGTGMLRSTSDFAALQNDGQAIWTLLENGFAIRSSVEGEDRYYTLNPGQGFISDIAGDGTYLYASWFQAGSKFTRYSIGQAAGSLIWVNPIASAQNDSGNAVAVDSAGNVIVTGLRSDGIFLNKYAYSGDVAWSKGFITNGFGTGVAVDASDNVYLCAHKAGAAGGGFSDILVTKYNAAGDEQWSKTFAGPDEDAAKAIAIGPDGHPVITGYFSQSINIGGTLLTGVGGTDIFLTKLSSVDGSTIFAYGFGSIDPGLTDFGSGVAIDSSGNIFLSGQYANSIDFGNGTGVLTGTGHQAFLVKFNSSGIAQWSKSFGGALSDTGAACAVFTDGAVVVVGYWRGTTNFGLGSVTSSGNHDIFIAKYESGGTPVWVNTFGGDAQVNDQAYGVTVDRDGNVIACGMATGNINFGGGNVVLSGNDAWAAKYQSDGAFVWDYHFTGVSIDKANGVATDASGNVYVTGSFYGDVDFGGVHKQSIGGGDAYVLKLGA